MTKFNVVDLLSIQECMEGYKIMLNLIIPVDETEKILREHKLHLVSYIIDKCDDIIEELKNE